jgi:CheY-like chemotaxis protein
VLVVDDNPVNCMVCEGMLAELGCTSVTAISGPEALILAARQRFDAILMDLSMPGMDGIEACKLLRAREQGERRTPIVAVSAHAAESHRQPCLDAGMDDFLCKPFSLTEVASILGRWLLAAAPGSEPARSPVRSKEDVLPSRDLDVGALDRIRALDRPDRPSMLPRVVAVFIASSGKQLGEIRHALAADDLERVRGIAHSLKASFGNVGANQLARLAAELERACVRGDVAAANSVATDIERGHPLAVAALQIQLGSACA